VVEAVAAALAGWEAGTPSSWIPAVDEAGPRWSLRNKKTEQAHLSLAVRGLPLDHPDRYALSLLSVILGEGMSSRLFLELREKRGLVYDVHSYVSHFLDTGAFTIYAGVDPKNAYEALQLVLAELARLRDDGIGEEELTKAKEMSKGRLALRLEDSRAVSAWVGGQEILLGQVRSPEEVLAEIEAVGIGDLKRVAGQLLAGDQLYLAVVGPFRSDKRFAALLRL
jgi:predicted Zn-dependent peptidase